ncbi:MAG: DUF547 domain-containing protein [Desulfobacterales bacterium]|nr:DUF547 domain-containing protein [Desulfobacterales bacterium]
MKKIAPHPKPKTIVLATPSGYKALWFTFALLGLIFAAATLARAQSFDHSGFDALLKKHVRENRVDYEGLKKDQGALNAYLAPARGINGRALSGNEGLAFWINMYNAWTLKLILEKYPEVGSIKDYGSIFSSPWDREFVLIGGEILTLGEIEHKILRKEYRDPRIHFAINCASISCPPLISEAYRPQTLDAQLDKATIDFINGPGNTFLKEGKLYVSRIFKWYKSDFKGTRGYIQQYARGDLAKAFYEKSGPLKVVFMAYDWSLNDIAHQGAAIK